MKVFTGSATGDSIYDQFADSFSKIGLETPSIFITIDSGANILKACRIGSLNSIKCICHRFNTAVNDAWKISKGEDLLFDNFEQYSNSLIEYVNRIKINQKLPIKLQSGCPTRPWRMLSSKFSSLKYSFEKLEIELSQIGQEYRLKQIDNELLFRLCPILDLFTEAFDELEQTCEPTINKVIPLVISIKDSLRSKKIIDSDRIYDKSINILCDNFIKSIELKVESAISDIHYASTYLDPAFQNFLFAENPEKSIDRAKKFIKSISSKTSDVITKFI